MPRVAARVGVRADHRKFAQLGSALGITGFGVGTSGSNVQHDVSSGGVLFRDVSGKVEVVLILTRPDRWQLPKGGIEPGETREQTARREVREETGVDGEVLEHLETIEYWFTAGTRRQRRHKSVHLFLLRFLSGDTAEHDDESMDAAWFPIDTALEKLTFANERHALELAKERIDRLRTASSGGAGTGEGG